MARQGFCELEPRLRTVSAQPGETLDPLVILQDLPERDRACFLRQYHEAIEAAYDPAAYRRLQRVLRAWSFAVVAVAPAQRAV